jgi:hypothetical protein
MSMFISENGKILRRKSHIKFEENLSEVSFCVGTEQLKSWVSSQSRTATVTLAMSEMAVNSEQRF